MQKFKGGHICMASIDGYSITDLRKELGHERELVYTGIINFQGRVVGAFKESTTGGTTEFSIIKDYLDIFQKDAKNLLLKFPFGIIKSKLYLPCVYDEEPGLFLITQLRVLLTLEESYNANLNNGYTKLVFFQEQNGLRRIGNYNDDKYIDELKSAETFIVFTASSPDDFIIITSEVE